MEKKLSIGKIVFIVSTEKKAIVPVQIVEINKKETVQGEQISYSVQDPSGRGPHNLENIDGKRFYSLKDAKNFMLSNAQKAIDEMISVAEKMAKEAFHEVVQGSTDSSDIFSSSDYYPDVDKTSKPENMKTSESSPKTSGAVGSSGGIEIMGPDGKTVPARIGKIKEPPPPPQSHTN